jgi:hypothetical protein
LDKQFSILLFPRAFFCTQLFCPYYVSKVLCEQAGVRHFFKCQSSLHLSEFRVNLPSVIFAEKRYIRARQSTQVSGGKQERKNKQLAKKRKKKK